MTTIGSLFSGIGGFELGLGWAGFGPVVWQVEIDSFCREVLQKHWPNARQYVDVKTVGRANLAPVDLICGGFPCQDVSGAGRGAGLAGSRSGLWYEMRRIVDELRPRLVAVENVASGKSRWVCEVRGDLRTLGYRTLALGIGANDVGAPHRRARVFVIADSNRGNLRHESEWEPEGWSIGVRRRGQAFPRDDGAQWSMADYDEARRALGPDGEPQEGRPRGNDATGRGARPGGWSFEPAVGRVAHGVPDRMDRLMALGNAIVPHAAEIVGRVIRERWL